MTVSFQGYSKWLSLQAIKGWSAAPPPFASGFHRGFPGFERGVTLTFTEEIRGIANVALRWEAKPWPVGYVAWGAVGRATARLGVAVVWLV